jgi:hypothetical protein
MKYIRNYESFKRTDKLDEAYKRQILLFENVNLQSSDEELFKKLFEKVLNNYRTSESVKQEIKEYVSASNLLQEGFLNESFFGKLKDRWDKAVEVSKKLSDKAEEVLGNVIQKVKDAVSFVKKIGEGIKEMFSSVIEKAKAAFTENIKGGKIKEKVEELTKTKKDGLVADLKTAKNVVQFYTKEFMNKLLGSTEKNMTEFLEKEQEPVTESYMINEGGNVIATLVHKIEAVPPFSWLHKVAQAGEAGAAAIIKAISNLTQKLGGPAFELPVIAILVGIVIEQIVKGQAGGWLVALAGPTTPLGMAITGIKMVAAFVALIVAIDSLVGQKILGGGHGDHKEGDHKEGEKEKPEEGTEEKK